MSQLTWRVIGAIGTLLGLASLMIATPLQWIMNSGGGSPEAIVAGHRVGWTLLAVLSVLGPTLWVPGVATMIALARRRGWVLTTIGGLITMIGLTSGVGHLAGYFGLIGDLAGASLSPAEVSQLMAADSANFVLSVLLIIFLIGFTIGPVLLAAGLRRATLVPVWVPVTAVVAGIANFVPGPISGSVQLLMLAATWLPMALLLVRTDRSDRAAVVHRKGPRRLRYGPAASQPVDDVLDNGVR